MITTLKTEIEPHLEKKVNTQILQPHFENPEQFQQMKEVDTLRDELSIKPMGKVKTKQRRTTIITIPK